MIRRGGKSWAAFTALLVGATSVGCNGSSNAPVQSPPPVQPQQQAAVPPPSDQPAAPESQPAAGKSKKRLSKTASGPQEWSPDLFEVVDEAPKFDVLGPAAEVREEDRFVALTPDRGLDSSWFTVVDAPPATQHSAPAKSSVSLPKGFHALTEHGYSEHGLPLRILCEADDAVMALVPEGITQQGSNDGPPEARPAFSVYLPNYYIDVTEVTVGQYDKYREAQREKKKSTPPPVNEHSIREEPAVGVNWGAAQNYARWAGKELPTEAEWEKAARGPQSFRTPWGNGRAVWPRPRALNQIDPVGSFISDRSPYGVLDLAGNAKEWTADWFSPTAYEEAKAGRGEVIRNWTGPKKATPADQRVVKGNGPDWSAWHRAGRGMSDRSPDLGFRCVLRISTSDAKTAQSEK